MSGALEVFLVALRLGLTSFGGPIAHLAYFHREYVERRRWLDEAAFADLIALTQLLPGPASSQLGIAIGTRRAGRPGGMAAWLGFTLPSALLMTAFALVARGLDLASAGWVHGLALAAVAVVALAVVTMARTLTPDPPRLLLAVAVGAVAFAVPATLVQVAAIGLGALVGGLVGGGLGWGPAQPAGSAVGWPERSAGRSAGRSALVGLGLFGLLLVVLPLLAALEPEPGPLALVDRFYRAGALVFGGGHVVLPLLQSGVVAPGWVSQPVFLAGYGAAQALPGPLFTIAAYLGAVASIPPGGVPGALLALGAIFGPSFLLVFGLLPAWEELRAVSGLRPMLAGASAAVVGLLASALAGPVAGGALRGLLDVAVVAAAFVALATRRVPVVVVVAAAAVAGQLLGG